MPVTVHLAKAKIKDNNGNYHAIDAFSDQLDDTIDDAKREITTIGNTQLQKLQQIVNNEQAIIDNRADQYAASISENHTVTEDAVRMIAPNFDPNYTYSAGTYVRYATLDKNGKSTDNGILTPKLFQLLEDYDPKKEGNSWESVLKERVLLSEEITARNGVEAWFLPSASDEDSDIDMKDNTSSSAERYKANIKHYLIYKRKTTDIDYNTLVNTEGAVIFDQKLKFDVESALGCVAAYFKPSGESAYTDNACSFRLYYDNTTTNGIYTGYTDKPTNSGTIQKKTRLNFAATSAMPSVYCCIVNYTRADILDEPTVWIVPNNNSIKASDGVNPSSMGISLVVPKNRLTNIINESETPNIEHLKAYLKNIAPINIYYQSKDYLDTTSHIHNNIKIVYIGIPIP